MTSASTTFQKPSWANPRGGIDHALVSNDRRDAAVRHGDSETQRRPFEELCGRNSRKDNRMRIRNSVFIAIAALATAVTIGVAAPPGFGWRGSGGWAADGPYGRMFDPKSVVTVSGTISSVAEITPLSGMGLGVHLMLKAKGELVDVHLGPSWYVASQDADLKAGDAVEVRGSRIEIDGKPVVIAMELKRGQDVLVLRDADGFPRWACWRRGGPRAASR